MKLTRYILAGIIAGLVSVGASHAAATKLVFMTEPVGGAVGTPLSVQPIVEAQDDGGVADPAFNGPITISIKANTVVGGVQLTGQKTVNASGGVAGFTDLQVNQPGQYVLTATAGSLTGDSAAFTMVVALADVWVKNLPTTADGVNPATQLSGLSGIRSVAINSNPGSSWKGTIYLPRRHNNGSAGEIGPGTVFFWKGDKTLKAGGPNLLAPDGLFVNDPAIFDLTTGNAAWGIGVAEDDYVYVTGLNKGSVARYNPDGTSPVLVIPSGFGDGQFVRQMIVTGKGLGTTLWFINEAKNVQKYTANAVDGAGAPTAFTKNQLFAAQDNGNQHHQIAVNSLRDTLYYALFGSTTYFSPQKYTVQGVRDEAFPAYTLGSGCGVTMDSQDRVVYTAWPFSVSNNKRIVAMSPRNGVNLTDDGAGGVLAAGFVPDPNVFIFDYNQYVEMARYSDRHYFYLGNGSGATNGTTVGFFSTNMPAPDPKAVVVANPGTGNSLSLSWTLPSDPEAIGVNVYRSTTAGVLGDKVNGAPVTASPYTAAGLTSGTPYYFTVRTVGLDPFTNAQYESANVDQVSGTPVLVLPPDPPASITATDTTKGGEVLLTWTNPPLYADAIRIYRSTTAGALGTLAKTVQPVTLGAAAQYTDTGLVNGTPYFYTVKAVNGKNEESSNTAQVTATPTDQTAPTFGGLTQAGERGFPGYRLLWSPATDNSTPVTYRVFAGPAPDAINYATPVIVTTDAILDLKDMVMGDATWLVVRAVDAAGNTDTNTKAVAVTPIRSICDSDQNALVNFDKFNKQPDAGLPALEASALGAPKGGGAPDLVPGAFASGQYWFNTQDKKGKWSYQLPITAAGKYGISLFFNPDPALSAPAVTYTVTLPNGTALPVFTVDQTVDNDNQWNLLTTQDLTIGTLTILGDATTSTESDITKVFVSGAVRALLEIAPADVPIYKAASAPSIDGNITAGEWTGAPIVTLGKAWQDLIPGNWTGAADYTAFVQVKWDADALYLAANVQDSVFSLPATADNEIFNRDGLELFLGLDPNADPARIAYSTPGDFQILLSAIDTGGGVLAGQWYSGQATTIIGQTSNVAVKATAGGYALEAAIPWSALDGITPPVQNDKIGFCFVGDDNDQPTPGQDSAFSLTGQPNAWQTPQAWTKATLLGLPPAAIKGDINQDGAVTRSDVELAMKVAAGLVAGDTAPVSVSNGDMNADGKITLTDASAIERKVNGK